MKYMRQEKKSNFFSQGSKREKMDMYSHSSYKLLKAKIRYFFTVLRVWNCKQFFVMEFTLRMFQVKLHDRNQMISENFYFRGDGTVSIFPGLLGYTWCPTVISTLIKSCNYGLSVRFTFPRLTRQPCFKVLVLQLWILTRTARKLRTILRILPCRGISLLIPFPWLIVLSSSIKKGTWFL